MTCGLQGPGASDGSLHTVPRDHTCSRKEACGPPTHQPQDKTKLSPHGTSLGWQHIWSGDYKHTPVYVMLSLEAVSVPCLSPELFPDPQGRGKQAGVMKSAPHVAEASDLSVISGKTFTSLREEDTENAIRGACIRIQQIGPQATLTEATTGLGCGGTSPQTAPSCSVGGLGGAASSS